MCSGFSDNSKILDFIGIYFWKIEFLSFGVKIEKFQKSEIAILYRAQFYVFKRLRIVLHFKSVHSRNLQTFADSWPKIAEHDVTKTPFSQKMFGGFS